MNILPLGDPNAGPTHLGDSDGDTVISTKVEISSTGKCYKNKK